MRPCIAFCMQIALVQGLDCCVVTLLVAGRSRVSAQLRWAMVWLVLTCAMTRVD
jgi:hypothetical protein